MKDVGLTGLIASLIQAQRAQTEALVALEEEQTKQTGHLEQIAAEVGSVASAVSELEESVIVVSREQTAALTALGERLSKKLDEIDTSVDRISTALEPNPAKRARHT